MISYFDKKKLLGILSLLKDESHDDLLAKLNSLHVVSDSLIPENVIRMNSVFVISLAGSEIKKTMKLVYHFDDDKTDDTVSIFSPLGIMLLGMKKNETSFFDDGLISCELTIIDVLPLK